MGGKLSGGGLRAGWGWYRQRGWLTLAAVPLRVGIDVRKVTPEAANAGADVEAASPTTFLSPVFGAGLGGFWKPRSGWTVAAFLFADVDILGTNFTAQQQSARLTVAVAELWRVRPSLALAFGWGG